MANLEIAIKPLWEREGVYSNDPDDPGAETVWGISRVSNPHFIGWIIVDAYKNSGGNLRAAIHADEGLKKDALNFYRAEYWNAIKGDEIGPQDIADQLFDASVNMGTNQAVLFLQEALNASNRNQADYPDIAEDGGFGKGTLDALAAHVKNRGSKILCKIFVCLRGRFYYDVMKKNPVKEKYIGWFERLDFTLS